MLFNQRLIYQTYPELGWSHLVSFSMHPVATVSGLVFSTLPFDFETWLSHKDVNNSCDHCKKHCTHHTWTLASLKAILSAISSRRKTLEGFNIFYTFYIISISILTLGNEFSEKVLQVLQAVVSWMLFDFFAVVDDRTCNLIKPSQSAVVSEKDSSFQKPQSC